MMDKVQKRSNSECYIPLSEPCRVYISFVFENVTHDICNTDRRNLCVTGLNQQMLELIFIFEIALKQNMLING
jgi:hypothetical protein